MSLGGTVTITSGTGGVASGNITFSTGQASITLTPDGFVLLNECTPDQAARDFWRAVQILHPAVNDWLRDPVPVPPERQRATFKRFAIK